MSCKSTLGPGPRRGDRPFTSHSPSTEPHPATSLKYLRPPIAVRSCKHLVPLVCPLLALYAAGLQVASMNDEVTIMKTRLMVSALLMVSGLAATLGA